MEHFSTQGPPLSNCNSYDTSHKDSNVHYPLNDTENAVNLRGGNNNVRILMQICKYFNRILLNYLLYSFFNPIFPTVSFLSALQV